MKKKQVFPTALINFFLAVLLLPFSIGAANTFPIEYPEITAPIALLVDARYNEILYEKNAYDLAYPASTTKIMTAYLVSEAVLDGRISLDSLITATEASQEGLSALGSTQGIDPGEQMTVEDLLHCLMLASANEAGNILAIAISGDLETFVAQMNQKAEELGCTGTHYMNTHGLHDPDHYTTAYDLFLTFQAAMSNEVFAKVVGTATYTTQATNHEGERLFYNTNGLLSEWYYRGYSYEYCIGGKTGSTPEAGRCLVAGAQNGNEYMISVVLGTEPTILADGSTLLPQMAESRDLLKFGIDKFERRIITPGVEPVGEVLVTLSDNTDTVLVKAEGEIAKTLPVSMDLNLIDAEVILDVQAAEAPIAAGTKMGRMILSYEGEVYGELDVVTVSDVERSEILFRIQKVQKFLSDWGIYVVAGALALVGVGVGLQMTVEKRRRRHSWRSNQKKRYKSRK